MCIQCIVYIVYIYNNKCVIIYIMHQCIESLYIHIYIMAALFMPGTFLDTRIQSTTEHSQDLSHFLIISPER